MKKIFSSLLIWIAAIIWGFAFVAQTVGSDAGIAPFTFIAIRFIMGGIFLIPMIFLFERKRFKKEQMSLLLQASIISGLLLFCASATQQAGIEITSDPGKSGFLTALYTAFVPVGYFLIYRKKTAWNTWVGVALAISGIFLLCSNGKMSLTFGVGEILLLSSALLWTLQILSIDKYVSKLSPIVFSCGQFLVCGVLSAICAFVSERNSFSFEVLAQGKWSLLYCGILSSGIAFTLQAVAQKRFNPTYVSIIMSTESVFATIGGVLWNMIVPEELKVDQSLTAVGFVGCAIIFIGIVISQLDFTKKVKNKAGR